LLFVRTMCSKMPSTLNWVKINKSIWIDAVAQTIKTYC